MGRLSQGCPDCSATLVDNRLEHDSSCPFWAAEDERQAADRKWFEEHSEAQSYVRPIAPSEIIGLRLTGYLPPNWSAAGTIEVVQIRPGVRPRRFADTYMFPSAGVA